MIGDVCYSFFFLVFRCAGRRTLFFFFFLLLFTLLFRLTDRVLSLDLDLLVSFYVISL